MEAMYEMVKETEKTKKYKYYNINLWVVPEVASNIEDISYFFIRDYVKELLNSPKVVLSIPRDIVEQFFSSNGYILRRFHANKELHDKWITQSRGFKKRVSYLVNKKLLEVLNDELRIARPPATTS